MPTRRPYRALAAYYDAEYERHAILKQDLPFFLGQFPKRPRRQRILEVGCGTGRATIPLAQAGHRLVGIDYAKDMLAIADRKRDAVGLSERDCAHRFADATRFDLGETFDWTCVFFNTFLVFTTLAEQDAVLQNLRRHLKPRGRLWLDLFQPDFSLLARESAAGLDPFLFYVPELERTVSITTDVRRGKGPQVQRVTFRYLWFDEYGQEHREKREFDITYIFPRELQLLLERNGFRIEHLWGNYDGGDLKPSSPRMIVRCCRA